MTLPNWLIEKIELHQQWVTSLGSSGQQLELIDCDLANLDLSGINFSHAILVDCKLDSAKLKQTDLYAANLTSTSMAYADLSEAILVKAEVAYASLIHSSLQKVKGLEQIFMRLICAL